MQVRCLLEVGKATSLPGQKRTALEQGEVGSKRFLTRKGALRALAEAGLAGTLLSTTCNALDGARPFGQKECNNLLHSNIVM